MTHPLGWRRRAALQSLLVLFVLVVAGSIAPAAAQPARPLPAPAVGDTVWRVQLVDGSTLVGRVVAADDELLTIETEAGVRVQVPRDRIRAMQPARGPVVGGQHWPEDPNTSRLMFGPTARSVGAGRGYFGVFELFLPYVAAGVSDHVTIAGGTAVGPEITGEMFYLAPKVTVLNAPRAQLAVGALAIFLTRALDEGSAGVLYGVGTFGEPDQAVTAGVGFPFWTQGDDPIVNQPILMLGGESRLGRNTKLLTENYAIAGESVFLLSAGVRFFGERLSADAGLGLGIAPDDSFCCLPLVNFVYTFGGGR